MTNELDLVIADAHVHLPGGEVVDGWLAVEDGRVAAVGEGSAPAARTVHDAAGGHVIPGVVDIHTHFRDPGDTHKEDFTSGTLAAAFGGVTTVIDMPNTGHQVITPADFREKRDHLAGRSWVDYGLHALFEDAAADLPELAQLGVAGIKWMMGYGTWKGLRCQPSDNVNARANLIAAAETDVMVGVHAESLPWMNDLREMLREQGRTDVGAHADSRPPFVEAIATAEAAILCAEFGCRLHVHHLTSHVPLRSAMALRDALGARLTVETCPSYLFLTDEEVLRQGVAIQVNPPMRSAADQDAMWEGLRSGEIHCVASDHAPTVPEDKAHENAMDALPGVLGVETMLPLLLDGVVRGRITLARLIELLCSNPAELVRLHHRKGSLLPGMDADLVVVDLDGSSVVSGAALHSKHTFTPYEGRELGGAIRSVFLRGAPLVHDGQLTGAKPGGVHVPSRYPSTTSADAGAAIAEAVA